MEVRSALAVLAAASMVVVTVPVSVADGPAAPSVLDQAVQAHREGRLETLEIEVPNGAEPPAGLEPLEPEAGIGPGSQLRITFPGGDRTFCTANFIFEDPSGELYLGTAGHCLLPREANATHGPDADHDASGVRVEVPVEGCTVKPWTTVTIGDFCVLDDGPDYVPMGRVVYARQGVVGTDFGLVEIPDNRTDLVRTQLPRWGGPDGSATATLGDRVLHYGHGLTYASTPATRARIAEALDGGSLLGAWMAGGAVDGGDSGSGAVIGHGIDAATSGAAGLGVITHATYPGIAGVMFGTTVETAKADLRCYVELPVRVVPNGSLPGAPGPDCPTSGGGGDGDNATLPTVYIESPDAIELHVPGGTVHGVRLVANGSVTLTDWYAYGGGDWVTTVIHPEGGLTVPSGSCRQVSEDAWTLFRRRGTGSPHHTLPAGNHTLLVAPEGRITLELGFDAGGIGEDPDPRPVRSVDTGRSARFVSAAISTSSGAPIRASFSTTLEAQDAALFLSTFSVWPDASAGDHRMVQDLTRSDLCQRDIDEDVSATTPTTASNRAVTALSLVTDTGTLSWEGVYENDAGVWTGAPFGGRTAAGVLLEA